MAFPSVVTTNTSVENTATLSHTVSLPSGISAGDLLIVVFAVRDIPDVTWPMGWTEIAEIDDTTNSDQTLAVAYRDADGGEGATITVTTSATKVSAHTSYRISGAADPAVQAPEVSTGAHNLSEDPDPDSLTPTGGAKDYLWIACCGRGDNDVATAAPTNYGNLLTAGSTGFDAVASAERQLNASSEDPGIFNFPAPDANWVAATVAIHPAPGMLFQMMQNGLYAS